MSCASKTHIMHRQSNGHVELRFDDYGLRRALARVDKYRPILLELEALYGAQ